MDKTIALFLLKIFSLIWNKYFAPAATTAINTAVANRLAALTTAVLAGNLPDISWAKGLKYLKIGDGSVIEILLTPQKTWTAEAWTLRVAAARNELEILQARQDGQSAPKDSPDEETLRLWNDLYGSQREAVQPEIDSLVSELAEMSKV